jgi:hypothetical protein
MRYQTNDDGEPTKWPVGPKTKEVEGTLATVQRSACFISLALPVADELGPPSCLRNMTRFWPMASK